MSHPQKPLVGPGMQPLAQMSPQAQAILMALYRGGQPMGSQHELPLMGGIPAFANAAGQASGNQTLNMGPFAALVSRSLSR